MPRALKGCCEGGKRTLCSHAFFLSQAAAAHIKAKQYNLFLSSHLHNSTNPSFPARMSGRKIRTEGIH